MAEYEYAVVGILEGWNATLAVLEHFVPAFFQGARQRYWSEGNELNRTVSSLNQTNPISLSLSQKSNSCMSMLKFEIVY